MKRAMLAALLRAQLFWLGMLAGKEGVWMMAMFFAQRVILGKTAYKDVPAVLRPQVRELLEESGLGEMVSE